MFAYDMQAVEGTVADIVATTCLDELVRVSRAIWYVAESTNQSLLVQLCAKRLSGIMSPLLCR